MGTISRIIERRSLMDQIFLQPYQRKACGGGGGYYRYDVKLKDGSFGDYPDILTKIYLFKIVGQYINHYNLNFLFCRRDN